jgi:anti-sigma B factor antagonist
MEEITDEGSSRCAADDRVVEAAAHQHVSTDLELRARTRVARAPAAFDIRRVDHPLGVVLTLEGELDIATAPAVQMQLESAMQHRAVVAVDLSGLSFIDSTGLRVLVRAQQQLRDAGGQLVLLHGPRAVQRVFELASLDSYFEFCDSPSAALRTAPQPSVGSPRIPQPAPPDRPRPNSPATSEE